MSFQLRFVFKSAAAAAKQVVKTVIGEARGEIINKMIDVGWTTIKSSASLSTDEASIRMNWRGFRKRLNEDLSAAQFSHMPRLVPSAGRV